MGRWTKGLRLEPFNKYMITFQKKNNKAPKAKDKETDYFKS